jgi:hypothetical protein
MSYLVVPRVDDCIAMLMGSQARYKQVMGKAPGTYFLTRGWIDAGITIMDEFRQTAERYGVERARRIQQKMFSHYTHLAYIASEDGDQEPYRRVSCQAAEALGLEYQEIKGSQRLLQAMIGGRWNHDFVVVEPGKAVTLTDFKSFNPIAEAPKTGQ